MQFLLKFHGHFVYPIALSANQPTTHPRHNLLLFSPQKGTIQIHFLKRISHLCILSLPLYNSPFDYIQQLSQLADKEPFSAD